MLDKFLSQKICSRCGGELTIRIMSRFNEDVICMDCSDKEKQHPRYKDAMETEHEQVRGGHYNHPGLFAGQKYPF